MHSLTARLLITVLLSTAVPFVVFGWVVRGGVQQRLEDESVRVLMKMHATVCADEVDNLLEKVYRDSALIEIAVEEFFDGGPADDLRGFLDLLPQFGNYFQAVIAARVDGDVEFVHETDALDRATRRARQALPARRNVQDQEWFLDLVARDRPIVWLDRHMSPFLHRNPDRSTRNPQDYSVGLAFQTTSGAGAVLVLASWSRFQDILYDVVTRLREEAGLADAEVHVTDATGRVLASTDTERYNRPVGPPELIATIEGIGDAPDVVPYRTDARRFAGVAAVAGEAYRRQDWRCVVTAPESELFATSRDFARQLLGITSVIVAALLVWAVLASRAILRPVRDVAEATSRIAGGDLEARVPVRGRDELADLAERFNAMTADLAESRRVQRDAERQAAWAEMARQIAHEIKNPLTPMRMSAQMLQRALQADDPRAAELAQRTARVVLAQTDQLARIASDFRHFAGQPAQQLERVLVDDCVRDVAEDFAAHDGTDGPTVRVVPAAGDAEVEVDRAELRRVFMNLVQNALEAVGDAGEVELRSAVDGDRAVWTVRDTGPGIAEDVRARLFEPYFTTRSSGTGLGLAICRRIVETLGGTIDLVDAAPGRTTFAVSLPLAAAD